MRYEQRKSVPEVLAWLAAHGCVINKRSYQLFHWRVLRLMSLEQAQELGVDVDLLRAIRVRLKLPVDPRRIGSAFAKSIRRFDPRHRHRKIQVGPKPKRVPLAMSPKPSHQPVGAPADSAQFPRAGLIPSGDATEEYVFRGDPAKPETLSRQDWSEINKVARKKLLRINRQIWPNQSGTVFHFRTRQQYTREHLIGLGLSSNEAESCFQTF